MGNGSSPPGWMAQVANLGDTCNQAMKRDNLLRTHSPRQPF